MNIKENNQDYLKLYGRSNLLSRIKNNILNCHENRILIRGSSGIGKSAFLRCLKNSINKNILCLIYEIESEAQSIRIILKNLTVQLIKEIICLKNLNLFKQILKKSF
ncbi:ATP-binding protein [Geitlerinema splendidum]|nr:ATP-binding protein [Geitlerinema splendidum]